MGFIYILCLHLTRRASVNTFVFVMDCKCTVKINHYFVTRKKKLGVKLNKALSFLRRRNKAAGFQICRKWRIWCKPVILARHRQIETASRASFILHRLNINIRSSKWTRLWFITKTLDWNTYYVCFQSAISKPNFAINPHAPRLKTASQHSINGRKLKHSRIRHILCNNMWCSSSIMICDAVQVLAPLLSSTSPPPPPSKGPLIGNKLHRFSDDLYH